MNIKQHKLLASTRREVRKQLLIMVGMYLGCGISLMFVNKTLFCILLILIVLPSVAFLFLGRRAVTYCLWRAFGLFFNFEFIGILTLYVISSQTKISFWSLLAINLIIAALGAFITHFTTTIPTWLNNYDFNLQRKKIDLEKGLFSIPIKWAVRGQTLNYKYAWTPLIVVAGPSIAMGLRDSNDMGAYFMMAVSILLVWGGVYTGLIELYNAYKLLQIEKQIGKPLIIDAYAHEYGR